MSWNFFFLLISEETEVGISGSPVKLNSRNLENLNVVIVEIQFYRYLIFHLKLQIPAHNHDSGYGYVLAIHLSVSF